MLKKSIKSVKKLILSFSKYSFRFNQERSFQWTGMSRLGESKFGQIPAKNRYEAKQKIRSQGIIVKTIKAPPIWSRAFRQQDITQWIHHVATLMHTGTSLVQTLHILSACQTHPKLHALLTKIQTDLEAGLSFSETLQHHPKWFDPMVCALIELGERSGTLIPILEKIVSHQTKNQLLKQQLSMIFTYPCLIICIACGVSLHLLLNVIPQFQILFQNFHATLPLATRMLLMLADVVHLYGGMCLLMGLSFIICFLMAYRYSLRLRQACDQVVLKIPGIGHLCHFVYIARSFHALSIANQASLPLIDALQWTAPIAGNLCYQQGFLQIRTALIRGDSLRSAVHHTALFPQLVVHMLGLGEESGTLQSLFMDLAQYYTQRVEFAMQWLNRFIEPTLMLVLGLLIGGLVLAMYLPIIKLGTLV
ncbi:MAG: hypothetical protein CK424_08665 [Legionella sp.]|nr:MAG: hypothetical protein CK424_08665 [Legionella sp.]